MVPLRAVLLQEISVRWILLASRESSLGWVTLRVLMMTKAAGESVASIRFRQKSHF